MTESVAAEVRALMARRQVSGTDLAHALDIPQTSLARRIRGRYPFDVELLAQIADYFGVPVVSFFPAQPERGGHPTGGYGPAPRSVRAAVGNLAA